MNKISVLKVAPNCPPEVVTIQNDLRSLQEAVSIDAPYVGLIEIVWLDAETCLVLNEGGKLIGLEPNRRLRHDILCGTFYVMGQDEEGNLTSLSPAAIEQYKKVFAKPEVIDEDEINASVMFIPL